MKQYANQQPKGFVNHAGGQVGKFFTEHLIKTGKHVVTAITRSGTSSTFADPIKTAHVDYDSHESLVTALKGQDFLIITLSLAAAPETHSKLAKAASKAGVPYIMPNAYSVNFYGSESLRKDIPIGNTVMERISEVQELGMTCIALMVGFWYEFSLSVGASTFGFDLDNRTATYYDDGQKRINVSSWEQCGRAVAALLDLKRLPDNESDKSVTVSHFQDRPLFVSSSTVNQREILESLKRITHTGDADWKVTYQQANERYKEGMDELAAGNQMGFYKAMYARVFYAAGDADFETDNELLGLVEEDIDELTRKFIKTANPQRMSGRVLLD
ncbi:hypothetical protein BM221_004891 [Beauveria bassiana]|uniref:NAD(P)-binding domain-containing protein n=1 Tax=Beauveria bassiana TaxID=176275 RepID=A0A2N6NSI5_BEABA|nr:hypothetical protein BM221_004891 [Beauveria bassiana]